MLRKHINCMDLENLKNIPFYIWECLNISLPGKDINIVIRNPIDMDRILKFLIFKLQTHDGIKNSAKPLLEKLNTKAVRLWKK